MRAATEGTVWAHIVREGRVLAGDPHLLEQISIGPMTPDTLHVQLGLVRRRLRRAIRATTVPADETPDDREMRQIDGTVESARAAHAITAALAGFEGPNRHGPFHTFPGATEAAEAERIPGTIAAQPVWEQRIRDVVTQCETLFDGALAGHGPLAALRETAAAHGLTAALATYAIEIGRLAERWEGRRT